MVVWWCGLVEWLQGPQLGYRATGWHLGWRGRECVRRRACGMYGEWGGAVGACGTWGRDVGVWVWLWLWLDM